MLQPVPLRKNITGGLLQHATLAQSSRKNESEVIDEAIFLFNILVR